MAKGAGGLRRVERVSGPERAKYAWQRTVLVQVDDGALAALVGREASLLHSEVFLGDPQDPDVYAIPYFIAIVHRWSMGPERWADFMEHQVEVEDATPIIVVDGLGTEGNWAVGPSVEIVDWKGLREADEMQAGESSVDTAGVRLRRAMRVAHVRAMAWEPE